MLLKKMYNAVIFLCLWSWRRERKKPEANRNRLHLLWGSLIILSYAEFVYKILAITDYIVFTNIVSTMQLISFFGPLNIH